MVIRFLEEEIRQKTNGTFTPNKSIYLFFDETNISTIIKYIALEEKIKR
jgi:hypothetical protein